MWRLLLQMYNASLLNEGQPECLFAKTEIFNEGWLLRSVLKYWKTSSKRSKYAFFRFPPAARVYSEGQLRTPFKARPGGDDLAESNTRVDGVAGHFSIAPRTKSGIQLAPGCQFVAVFEAKLYSPIGKRVRNVDDYDQISRTTACLVHALLQAEPSDDLKAHLVVLYPADNLNIVPGKYKDSHVKDQIDGRLKAYKDAGEVTDEIRQFEAGWEGMLGKLQTHFVTWEAVLDEIEDENLEQFYDLCKESNA